MKGNEQRFLRTLAPQGLTLKPQNNTLTLSETHQEHNSPTRLNPGGPKTIHFTNENVKKSPHKHKSVGVGHCYTPVTSKIYTLTTVFLHPSSPTVKTHSGMKKK